MGTFSGQKDFYEKFYAYFTRGKIETMKQALRLKIIAEFFEKSDFCGKKVLIAGCGNGQDTTAIPQKTIAFDFSFTAVGAAVHNFPSNVYLVADGMRLPFKNESFHCIVCSEVMEHVIHPGIMLMEFNRVLKKDGQLIITVPNWLCWYGAARKIAEFILKKPVTACDQPLDNWYTPKRLRQQIERNFKIVEARGSCYYPPFAKGYCKVLDNIMFPIFRFFKPFDILLGKISPWFGSHIIAVRCTRSKIGESGD